jgi:hypothetical protein
METGKQLYNDERISIQYQGNHIELSLPVGQFILEPRSLVEWGRFNPVELSGELERRCPDFLRDIQTSNLTTSEVLKATKIACKNLEVSLSD